MDFDRIPTTTSRERLRRERERERKSSVEFSLGVQAGSMLRENLMVEVSLAVDQMSASGSASSSKKRSEC